jgi:hypothetical protein
VHAASPEHAEAMVPVEGSHVAPAATYVMKQLLHCDEEMEPAVEQ